MNDILIKINEAIRNYYNEYKRHPNAILINEHDLNVLKCETSPLPIDVEKLTDKAIYECCGLKVIPIKYGEPKAVEVLE